MTVFARLVRRVSVAGVAATLAVTTAAFPLPAASQVVMDADVAAVTQRARALGASVAEAQAAVRVYGNDPLALVWTTTAGTLNPAAEAALVRLRGAATHALRPDDYLTPAAARALGAPMASRDARLERDVALTLAVLRYMRHLHLGRVDPRRVGLRLDAWAEPHDFPPLLAQALAAHRVPEMLDGLAPPVAAYARLVAALARYRGLAGHPLPALPSAAVPVQPGDAYGGVHALGRRLAAEGDLPVGAVPPPEATMYGEELAGAVSQFQKRHGLTSDGVVGTRTTAALNVPLARRADQIALALERLRWLPDLGERRVVVVNIPMFRLWAWEAGQFGGAPAQAMDVIVGRAMRTETPVFVETMDHVIFRPYWNVPTSIVRDEILPAVGRRPGYLASQQLEIVRGPGDDARVVAADGPAIAALAAGTLRLRQRPGPHNALGLVKFVFPNRESVYMHGTPVPSLFARDRRDFSHGCIRVADPPALATWALARMPGWGPARVAEAMTAGTSARVEVGEPIDVVLFYMTAAVAPEDGTVHFADDIYGHDVTLERALAGRQ